jgi:hypothetical protein
MTDGRVTPTPEGTDINAELNRDNQTPSQPVTSRSPESAQPSAKEVFEMKERCQVLGIAYEKANDVQTTQVCYSPVRNTCLANTLKYPNDGVQDTQFAVVDLISGGRPAGYCWWTHRVPYLNACLLFQEDALKALAWVQQQQALMHDLMNTCAP